MIRYYRFLNALNFVYLVLSNVVLFSLFWMLRPCSHGDSFDAGGPECEGTIATGIRNALHAYSEHLHEEELIFLLEERTSDND